MKSVAFVLAIGVCLSAAAWGQTAPAGSFEDLSTRASAALKQKDSSQAAKLYREAVALKPSWAEGWFYLGASLYELRQYPEAQKAFQRAAALTPNKGVVWAFIGLCEYQKSAYAPALANFKKAEKIGLPDNLGFIASVHNCAAIVYLREQDFQDAVGELQGLAVLAYTSPITTTAF
ncbi:MAG: tetratricopeptide repeat protein, partial [Bryobacteraceae bacterium]